MSVKGADVCSLKTAPLSPSFQEWHPIETPTLMPLNEDVILSFQSQSRDK